MTENELTVDMDGCAYWYDSKDGVIRDESGLEVKPSYGNGEVEGAWARLVYKFRMQHNIRLSADEGSQTQPKG